MKKIFFALLLIAAAAKSYAAESVGGPSTGPGVYIDSLRVHIGLQKALLHVSSVFWGSGSYGIDLSSSNPVAKDMLATALSAMNSGKRIRITVDVPGGCSGTTSVPACGFGSFIYSITILKD